MIVYSGTMEQAYDLPFHITSKNESIVFEEDVIRCICENQWGIYEKHYLTSPNYHLFEREVNNQKAYPLIAFLNECVNVFDYSVQANVERIRKKEKSLTFLSNKIYPIVSAIAKVGLKIQIGGMKEGETPSQIFEREMRHKVNRA